MWLETTEMYSLLTLEARILKSGCLQGHAFSETLHRPLACLFLASDGDGQSLAPLQSLPSASHSLLLLPVCASVFFFFFFFFNKFIYLFVFIFGHIGSSLRCAGFSLRWLLLLRSTGSRREGFSSCGARA